MSIVYQINAIEKVSDASYRVVLCHLTTKEIVPGKLTLFDIGEKKNMVFTKDGEEKGCLVKGKYSKPENLTFFHSGETQFVFLDNTRYIDVIELMDPPGGTEPVLEELLII